MAANTLSILRPSVNNLTVRIFVRAAGLDFDEVDVWGKKGTPEFLAKDPADLTPLLEEEGLPKGSLWESCAIMQYLCNKHGLDRFYPRDPAERAMIDSAMFYLIGTLYPLVARATYPTLGFPQYAGEVGTSDADDAMKAKAQKDAEAAIAAPLEAYRAFFLADRTFIGGDAPSIADIRLAATLEFLRGIDYDLPAWDAAGRPPAGAAAGHSLGEYAALVAAGALDFEDALALVDERAAAMAEAAEMAPGGMVAMLGGDPDGVADLAAQLGLTVANDNGPGQLVLSGRVDALGVAEEHARAVGARARRLDVGGAFHSPLMGPAAARLASALARVEFRPPAMSVYSCATAAPFADPRRELADNLLRPVRWRETVLALEAAGIDGFTEVGPGRVLTGMVRRIVPAEAAA